MMNKHITRSLLFFSISLALTFSILASPPRASAHHVQTTWNMFGDNARHSRFNPYENSIAPGNVVKLSNAWLFHTGSVIGSSPAAVNGVVYVGSRDGNLYTFCMCG